jgi:uroporphyrinogen III methyltransferase/synthase
LHQASELCELLESRGAQVLPIPVLEIQPPADAAPLDAALRRLADYPWILFTSANAVECTVRRLSELGLPRLANGAVASKICAIGPATAKALEAAGCPVDLVPEEYIAESVVEAFAPVPLAGVRVLIPRAAAARDIVPDALRERGALVDAVEAYRSGVPANAAARVAEICAARTPIQWVTFTSGSTVKNFLAVGGASLLAGARIATIGPATSEVARKHGLAVDAEAVPHTALGLVDAICHAARP